LRNVLVCVLIAKFGAFGPEEASVILACAAGLVVWQVGDGGFEGLRGFVFVCFSFLFFSCFFDPLFFPSQFY
jgi:hypothetical protein